MIKLSVIIPIYKVENCIEKCLTSIIEQESNDYLIECILINDCTPDNSMIIVQNVIDKYQGNRISFSIIHHHENLGLSAARNSGILAANGDYILFVDSDDYIPIGSFIYLVKYAVQYPDIEVIESNAYDRKRAIQINPYTPSILLFEDKEIVYSKLINFQFSVYVWNKMIKRSTIIKHKLFFEKGIIHEDILWSYKLFASVSSVLYLPKITYIYEYNPASITNTTLHRVEEDVRSHLHICNKIFEMPPLTKYKKNNYFVEYHLFIFTFLLRAIDLAYQKPISEELRQSLRITKRQLFHECVLDYRFLLTLLFIIMYKPFSSLLKVRLFRRLYYKIAIIIKGLSKMTDILHKNWYFVYYLH